MLLLGLATDFGEPQQPPKQPSKGGTQRASTEKPHFHRLPQILVSSGPTQKAQEHP